MSTYLLIVFGVACFGTFLFMRYCCKYEKSNSIHSPDQPAEYICSPVQPSLIGSALPVNEGVLSYF